MVACSAAIDGEEAFPEYWVLKVVHRYNQRPTKRRQTLTRLARGRAKAKQASGSDRR
jgi:hypothetical protein